MTSVLTSDKDHSPPIGGVFRLCSLYIPMNYSPMDPSEFPGTPEYEEVFKEQYERRQALLDLIEEQADYDLMQFPQRFSH